jgi:AcrR family transcriptional regulator
MSQSDETRAMALLWRSELVKPSSSSPGPKPRLDIDEVLAAAIAVADANPSAGLSMRAVAERLGVTAMAIYGYVPSKGALVALAYDAIHAEMPDFAQGDDDWRQGAIAWTEALVDLYLRHPWALRVSYARPVLGPNEQFVLESLVGVLRATGLGPRRLRSVVGLVFHAVRGTARTIAEARQFEEAKTEGEWWQASSTALDEVVPDFADRFPHSVWLLSQAEPPSADDDSSYVERQSMINLKAGLGVLLDGVEAVTASNPGAKPTEAH